MMLHNNLDDLNNQITMKTKKKNAQRNKKGSSIVIYASIFQTV